MQAHMQEHVHLCKLEGLQGPSSFRSREYIFLIKNKNIRSENLLLILSFFPHPPTIYGPFFISMYTIFPLGVLYPEHLQLALDFVVIDCSLDSIRLGLVQGCKAPNVVG